ncbi:MAG: phosphoribosylformylglycinamidine synthase subunit PurQ [Candidatus Nitrohelix vancouverensis]|uniref:Phosphoribosylformylglycinamidine synthase subunit PurQ n=1 Tax=Candidatus Nitrohelix vancouverensis TaxID=2705534 RepID=A0A7T0C1P6_9BACT|nr:MAG: phosphoribosylformylglycinamidine synthase subunit PurQ [Candidatus Nitrohelix vancouverensis]
MKCGVIVFPGSNCDRDCFHILSDVMKLDAEWVWHKDEEPLDRFDFIVLPGGFSYGDYLRAGAIAKYSPVMKSLCRYAESGGAVLGICNGFQILVEAGLLPGALLHNQSQKFICKNVPLRVESSDTPFTRGAATGDVLTIPIAHHQGCYYADPETLADLEANQRVIFRYCGPNGEVDEAHNPNGSSNNIAGICNAQRNVVGMMPHPERCADPAQNDGDGKIIFQSILNVLQ